MDRTLFRALPLPAADSPGDEASTRLLQVMKEFESHFGRPPVGIARAPGRVNLIGEHIDYEGYAVLPMAIEQSVFVAFNTIKPHSNSDSSAGVKTLNVTNGKPQYKAVSLSMDGKTQDSMQKLGQEGASWAKYVLCGVLGLRDGRPELFIGQDETELQLLVDGDVPAGCGLSSSSALVVAAALATSSALQPPGKELLSRVELAELCRKGEHHVGTMGGGMDQAVACLAQRGVALHLDFSTLPASSNLVNVPDATAGVTFVVANSLVLAEKAVDATTRFNKRVVECALAAKLIAKKAGVDDWRDITRLVDVQKALTSSRADIGFAELQKLATTSCPLQEYSIGELENEFGEPIVGLFSDSSLAGAIKAVIASASTFKLQQRAIHVWSEAERVEQFRTICATSAKELQLISDQVDVDLSSIEKNLQSLGEVMSASHHSCKTLYECSCRELDDLIDAAMSAGALGARLTGAGWGGCIVALVRKTEVSSFMMAVQSSYYSARGITTGESLNAMFESAPATGADIFTSQME